MKNGVIKKGALAVLLSMFLFTLSPCWSQDTIDMSESILKIQGLAILYDLGEKGFAVNDVGDKAMKFFDWNFKLVSRFPIVRGEGPGEVKDSIASVCIVDGKIYILVLFDKNIKVFNQLGKYEKDILLDASPREMFFKNGSLYLPNMRINATMDSFSLGIIADPFTGKKTKDIFLKERLISSNIIDDKPIMIGMASIYDVGNDGSIYFLNSTANILAVIDSENRVKYKLDLPYKQRELRRVYKENGEENLEINTLDWYPDMRAFDDGVYICFQKTLAINDTNNERKYQTVVIKVSGKEDISEKAFEGRWTIIGQHKANLYLFNSEDYKVIPVKLSD
ncbi:MAG TPA: hypothetical protein VK186_14180 [Candidatus Deferrimicrobium sp.]|nr:hypothetical protein [Candidatus Kapabacteria bacterium]HLP59984.1 hypothetical protein [Candidatus Deferrimicrobium sp.]